MSRFTFLFLALIILAEASPAWAGPDYDQAVQLYNQRQYRPALALFLRAASTEPKNAGTYFYAANCFYQLGNKDRAIQTYNMVVQYYPGSPQAVMAQDFLKKLNTSQAQQGEPAHSESTATASPHATKSSPEDKSPVDCTDLLHLVRSQKDHPPVSDSLKYAMQSKLSSMPHDVGKLLHERGVQISLATSLVDAHPEMTNEEGRGYEGNTYKSCPGMFYQGQVLLAEHVLNESDESLRPAFTNQQVLDTFAHECGHAIDWCLGWVSETQEFSHVYLLDCGNLNRNAPETANELRYYMQKAEAGQHECCGELIGVLLGKSDAHASKMRTSFPLTLQFLKDKLHM